MTVVPSPGAAADGNRAAMFSTIFLTVARPRPVPARFVVTNGAKTLSAIFSPE